MGSVTVFAIYVLKNRKLSATRPKCLRDPFRGRDPPVGNHWSRELVIEGVSYIITFGIFSVKE